MSPRLVIVEWTDSTCIAAWQDRAEIAEMATNRAWRCRNVGWLVHEDTECVVLAARLTESGDYAGLTERIPRKAIVSVQDVATTPAIIVPADTPFEVVYPVAEASMCAVGSRGKTGYQDDMAAIRRVATRGSD